MKLYIKQKVFSFKDRFTVYDEWGRDKYYVEGEFFSFGKKLHVYDLNGTEVAYIEQKVLSFLPKFFVFMNGQQVAEIVKQFSFFRPKYSIAGLGWDIEGNFWQHDYLITNNGAPIVTIMKEWMTWGDCYELDIADEADEQIALAVVLTIDCVLEAQRAAAASS
ncbi:MAG: LURP-one-related family protein [Acutalibacteraceae bacterium]|nr:LURP-one-related family protein [Acutalibacteraceae bacterium]